MKPPEDNAAGRSEPFTTAQNDEVYQRLIAGDEQARDEMIQGNMALVIHRAEVYLRNAPQMEYYRDDMISAGFVGLCEAVDRMQKIKRILKPTGFMSKAIDTRIAHLVDEANTVVVPERTQSRARVDGMLITPPRIVSDKALLGIHDTAYQDRTAVKELYEETLACCRNERERKIVSMRAVGYTDAEIASAVNLSRRRVASLREEIFMRFNDRCPEYALLKDRKKQGNDQDYPA